MLNRQGAKTKREKIAFVASEIAEAKAAAACLAARYGNVAPRAADVIVALGGDGLMLKTARRFMSSGKPIYGMHQGSIGFLMNEYREEGLRQRIAAAVPSEIHPLIMHATDLKGRTHTAHAINEVSMWRQTYQASKLRISVDGVVQLRELICDGVIVATPAGSTAYNLSADGPIVPIGAPLLALTPISPFRPRRWRGALLSNKARIRIDVLEAQKRPVSVAADHSEFRNISFVETFEDADKAIHLLFDPGHALDERTLREQFSY
jgi:NAD+ kinase